MKIQTKFQKLCEAEKYAEEKRAEITREIVETIAREKLNTTKLCAGAGVSRDIYYYFVRKNALPTEIIRKFLRTDFFK